MAITFRIYKLWLWFFFVKNFIVVLCFLRLTKMEWGEGISMMMFSWRYKFVESFNSRKLPRSNISDFTVIVVVSVLLYQSSCLNYARNSKVQLPLQWFETTATTIIETTASTVIWNYCLCNDLKQLPLQYFAM